MRLSFITNSTVANSKLINKNTEQYLNIINKNDDLYGVSIHFFSIIFAISTNGAI